MKIGILGTPSTNYEQFKDGLAAILTDYHNIPTIPFKGLTDTDLINYSILESLMLDFDKQLIVPTLQYSSIYSIEQDTHSQTGLDFKYDGIILLQNTSEQYAELNSLLIYNSQKVSDEIYLIPSRLPMRDKIEAGHYFVIKKEDEERIKQNLTEDLFNEWYKNG